MTNDIPMASSSHEVGNAGQLRTMTTILLVLTLMLSGRAMTLGFLGSLGGQAPGDPPSAWLMPLVGDAVIGLTALPIAYLVWRRSGRFAWTVIVVWNAVAIWDALSAFLVHQAVPWPSFFMLELFGASMFFAASAMHAVCLYLVCRQSMRDAFLGPCELSATASPDPAS